MTGGSSEAQAWLDVVRAKAQAVLPGGGAPEKR